MSRWTDIRREKEESLAPYAAKSIDTIGREKPEKPCEIRLDFERDANRILYSEDFRRLRHKTQVFFNAKNDHICTRMEHVLYVNSISATICRTLNLNQDLTSAIALGHDIGHAPFGHSGEKCISECALSKGNGVFFEHERHGLRVVDRLSMRISKELISEKCGLNLTYEVRDGIVSHCGEKYSEYKIEPDKTKIEKDITTINHKLTTPYTLEGCLVRLVDKIAYVGRDIEDAMRAKLMDYNSVSPEIRKTLGKTNGDIINTLVTDVIENSYGNNYIALSDEKGRALEELINTNVAMIYKSEPVLRYEKGVKNTIEGLFDSIYDATREIQNYCLKGEKMEYPDVLPSAAFKTAGLGHVQSLYSYIKEKNYSKNNYPEQITVDYIAGMTDAYAMKTYEDIYWI